MLEDDRAPPGARPAGRNLAQRARLASRCGSHPRVRVARATRHGSARRRGLSTRCRPTAASRAFRPQTVARRRSLAAARASAAASPWPRPSARHAIAASRVRLERLVAYATDPAAASPARGGARGARGRRADRGRVPARRAAVGVGSSLVGRRHPDRGRPGPPAGRPLLAVPSDGLGRRSPPGGARGEGPQRPRVPRARLLGHGRLRPAVSRRNPPSGGRCARRLPRRASRGCAERRCPEGVRGCALPVGVGRQRRRHHARRHFPTQAASSCES